MPWRRLVPRNGWGCILFGRVYPAGKPVDKGTVRARHRRGRKDILGRSSYGVYDKRYSTSHTGNYTRIMPCSLLQHTKMHPASSPKPSDIAFCDGTPGAGNTLVWMETAPHTQEAAYSWRTALGWPLGTLQWHCASTIDCKDTGWHSLRCRVTDA